MCFSKHLLCLVAILTTINMQAGCTLAFHKGDSEELGNGSDPTEDTVGYRDTEINSDNENDSETQISSDDENDSETQISSDDENDSETGSENDDVCDAVNFIIESSLPNLLILLDRSGSMSSSVAGTSFNRWEVCSNAVLHLASDLDELIRFGLGTFSSCSTGGCSPGSIAVPISTNNATAIEDFLSGLAGEGSSDGDELNGQGLIKYLCDSKLPETSTGSSLASLVGEASLREKNRENAVLLLTDGQESPQCIIDNIDGPEGARLLLGQSPSVRTYAVGFAGAKIEEIEAIAKAGGTSKAYFADNPDELIAALRNITQEVSVSCTYNLPGLDSKANKEKVNFYFDGVTVGFDKDCRAGTGWDWTDDSKTAVEFCEDACGKMKSGLVKEVSAKFGCETIWVV